MREVSNTSAGISWSAVALPVAKKGFYWCAQNRSRLPPAPLHFEPLAWGGRGGRGGLIHSP